MAATASRYPLPVNPAVPSRNPPSGTILAAKVVPFLAAIDKGAETKTRESRKIPLHPALKALLATRPASSAPWYFTAEASDKYPGGGHWISTKRLNEKFVATVVRLGFPAGRNKGGFTIHSLRHFCERFCVHAGIPQRVIDTWLGHRVDRSTSAGYYDLSDTESQAFMVKVPFGEGLSGLDAETPQG